MPKICHIRHVTYVTLGMSHTLMVIIIKGVRWFHVGCIGSNTVLDKKLDHFKWTRKKFLLSAWLKAFWKWWKMYFVSSKKLFLVLKIFKFFLTTFWSCRKNSLIRKIRFISKFMTSEPNLQKIPIHILPNISQSKGNQRNKFGQLIEHKERNIFLQKLCRKYGWVTSSRPLFI